MGIVTIGVGVVLPAAPWREVARMSDLRNIFDDRWDALKSVVYPEFGADAMIAHEPMVWDAAHLIQRQKEEIERLQAIIAGDSDLSISEWHSDRAELLKTIGGLEDENTQLKQGYTAIRNDMSRVSKAAKEVQQENEDINQQMDRLCDDNVKLNDEYDELQKMFTAAAAHAEEL